MNGHWSGPCEPGGIYRGLIDTHPPFRDTIRNSNSNSLYLLTDLHTLDILQYCFHLSNQLLFCYFQIPEAEATCATLAFKPRDLHPIQSKSLDYRVLVETTQEPYASSAYSVNWKHPGVVRFGTPGPKFRESDSFNSNLRPHRDRTNTGIKNIDRNTLPTI